MQYENTVLYQRVTSQISKRKRIFNGNAFRYFGNYYRWYVNLIFGEFNIK